MNWLRKLFKRSTYIYQVSWPLPWYYQPSTLSSLWFWIPLIVFLSLAVSSVWFPDVPLPSSAVMICTWLVGVLHITVVEVFLLWRKQ